MSAVTSKNGTWDDDIITNNDSYVKISGVSGDDTITNNGSYVTIDGGTVGDDIITNSGSYVSINGGTSGDDTITNNGSFVTIDGGTSGDDSITNSAPLVSIDGNNGDDTIENSGQSVTINGGNGDDHIKNRVGNDVFIRSGNGADSIFSDTSNKVTIDAGNDNDTIIASGNYVSVDVGHGNDLVSITGFSSGVTVHGSSDNDTLITDNYYGATYQFVGGNDVIKNWNEKGKISLQSDIAYTRETLSNGSVVIETANGTLTLTDAKSKSISIVGGKSSVNGGDSQSGKNITNNSNNVTLTGTNYNDTVMNSGATVKINTGNGNDSVTLRYWTESESKKVTLDTGNGKDTIYAGGTYNSVNAGAGNDSIWSHGSYLTIKGGAGNDTLKGNYGTSKIYGEGGADFISISSYWNNTIGGGADSDTIAVEGGNGHSISGGASADRISLGSATNSTLYYAQGDGNDTVWGFNDTTKINISGSYNAKKSDNDIRITVGTGSILLKDSGKLGTININNQDIKIGEDEKNITPQEVIKKFMAVLDTTTEAGVSALNQAVNSATNGYFPNIDSAINKMLADCRTANNPTNFLNEYCDIYLDNDDTGAITGKDAGGSATEKSASDIVPEIGNIDNFTGDSFTTNGLTVNLGKIPYDGNLVYTPSSLSFKNLSDDTQKYIWQAFETWWASGAINLITDSYGSNYGFTSESTTRNMYFGFFEEAPNNEGAVTLAFTAKPGNVLAMAVNINSKVYGNLVNGGNPDGKTVSGFSNLDRTLAHEMTHAVMKVNVNNFGDLPQFITEGIAELTQGADRRSKSIQALANVKNISYLENSLALQPGTGTIATQNDLTDAYVGGYMFMRYLAKQGSLNYGLSSLNNLAEPVSRSVTKATSSAISLKGVVLTLSNTFAGNMLDLHEYSKAKKINAKALSKGIMLVGNKNATSISAGTGNDSIFANVGNDTVLGGKGNDLINGESGKDKIYGGDGDDSLNGGTGNDTLTGNGNKDVFIFGADFGKDIITDYTPGQDKIKLSEENTRITSYSVSGKNVVLNVGLDSITIKNGKGKKITVIDAEGNETTKVYGGASTSLTVTNKTKSPVTVGSAIKTIDASKRTLAVKITGNTLANTISGGIKNDTIYGGNGNDSILGNAGNDNLFGQVGNDFLKGGNGNDTLTGGKGNDSLWGNAGADKFMYANGDGKDVIFGFDNLDMLKITGNFSSSYNKAKDEVYFKVGTTANAITLKDFSATSFNVNGTAYKISGSKLVKK